VAERLTVQPGCTGLWQISTSARKLIGENPEFDLHYVRNWTLRLDLWIVLRTLPAMLRGREIDGLAEIPAWTGASVR
jgi:lipopolysaccharide/colanic/teichoic acid biosynthesis glycosyltransferase